MVIFIRRKVSADGKETTVTVNKADIALVMIAGQSNAAGDSSDYTMAPKAVGEYEGKFFITNTNGASIPTSSVTFEKAEYCAEHGGRMEETSASSAYDKWSAAAASALARKLVDLWDMKIWVVNAAVCASKIESWVSGGVNNTRFIEYAKAAKSEISADGHYVLDANKFGYLWLQGCSNGIGQTNMSMADYITSFSDMHNKFKAETDVKYAGIWQVRAGVYNDNRAEDYYMSGPRLAQYYMGNTTKYPDVHLLLDTDIWRYDADVKAYFENKYGSNTAFTERFGYDMPTTLSEIKPNLHHNQKGYNELGDEGAVNLAKILGSTTTPQTAEIRDYTGIAFEGNITIKNGEELVAVPVLTNVNYNPSLGIELKSENESVVSVNNETYKIKGVGEGTTKINICCGETTLGTYNVTVEGAELVSVDLGGDFEIDFTSANAKELVKSLGMTMNSATVEEGGIYTRNTSGYEYIILPIAKRTSGKYVIEHVVNFEQCTGLRFKVWGSGGWKQIAFIDQLNVFTYGQSGPENANIKVANGVDITVKQVVDLDTGAYEFYLDGNKVDIPYPYLHKANADGSHDLTEIRWTTYPNNKAYIKSIKMYELVDTVGDFEIDFTAANAKEIVKSLGMTLNSATVEEGGIYTRNTKDYEFITLPVAKRTSGKYVIEHVVNFEQCTGLRFKVWGSGGWKQIVFIDQLNVYSYGQSGPVSANIKVSNGTDIIVKQVVDLDTGDYEFYLNGNKVDIPYHYLHNANADGSHDLTEIRWRTYPNNKGYIKSVKVYETGKTDLSKDFSFSFTDGQGASAVMKSGISLGSSTVTGKGIAVSGTTPVTLVLPERNTGKYIFEADYTYVKGNDINAHFYGNNERKQALFVTSDGSVYTVNQNKKPETKGEKVTPGESFNVKIFMDFDGGEFKTYINGKLIPVAYANLLSENKNFDKVLWGGYADGLYYIEKIKLYEDKRAYVDVNISAGVGGMVTYPEVKLSEGDEFELEATPDSDYKFDMWNGVKNYLDAKINYVAKEGDRINASFVASALMEKGDIDFNGKVDIRDAVDVLKTIAGIKIQGNAGIYCGDVTGDGRLTIDDAKKLLKYISRIVPSLALTPEEEEALKPEKYVVIGFDDGITQDARIMEIMSRYGLKATFFINSGAMGVDGSASVSNALGKPISHVRVTESEIRNGYYDGFEVESHSVNHVSLKSQSEAGIINQVQGDIDAIERIVGVKPKGLAYPGGTKDINETVVSVVEESTTAGYGRTTTNTGEFNLPERFLYWNPTASISSSNALSLAQTFVNTPVEDKDMLLCLWGHGYEFDFNDSWDDFEALCKYLSEQKDIKVVTFGEFYELFKHKIPR